MAEQVTGPFPLLARRVDVGKMLEAESYALAADASKEAAAASARFAAADRSAASAAAADAISAAASAEESAGRIDLGALDHAVDAASASAALAADAATTATQAAEAASAAAGSAGGSAETGDTLVAKLVALGGDARLPHTAVQGLGSAATADTETFAPTSHDHDISAITGLQGALDALASQIGDIDAALDAINGEVI